MKNATLTQVNQGPRVAWLGITIVLATLFFAILLWGLREAVLACADPGTLYVDGATGQDIIACGTTGTPCETISYTLNSRASEGDTILIAEGTYTENLTIAGITVTLRGGYTIAGNQWLADTGETIVHGNDAGRVFFFHGSNSVLEKLTITGGDAPFAEPWGGGVWVSGGDVTIRYSTITDNGDLDWSMGIEVNDDYGPAHLTLESSTVSYNTGWMGGGLHLWGGGASAEVRDVVFVGNRANGGGGIFIDNTSSAVIMNSDIFSNTADWGGGIAVSNNSTATIANNQIVSNTAYSGGGGLYAEGVTVTVRSNDFLSNTSQDDDGPAIWAGSSTLAADDNLFAYNASNAAWVGGAVRLWQSTMTLTNNVIARNQASGFQVTQSSIAFVNNTIVSNTLDGISLWDNGTVSLLRNNIIADNGSYAVGGDGTVTLSEYNDLWNNPSGSYEMAAPPGAGNIALDPQFVDAANGDYHLQGGSPCIDAGTGTGAPMEDFEEDPRPLDGNLDGTAAVDIGADEFNPPKVYLPLVLRDA